MTTATALPQQRHTTRAPVVASPSGVSWLLVSEIGSGALGFAATIHLARRLGPLAFGRVEFAAAVAAWLLVIVRSGVEQIVYREAARRPRLIGPLTDVLLGLKGAGAALGFGCVALVSGLFGAGQGGLILLAGLILGPSALVADVGPRATGRLGVLALAQTVRTLGLAVLVWGLVGGPGDAPWAASCAVGAELTGALVLLGWHTARFGRPTPRYRRRVWVVLAHRGALASAIRFGRVSLYGADLLCLGFWERGEVGPYAAARRVVFAAVALGLVLPASYGPLIGRAWAAGSDTARDVLGACLRRLAWLALPATAGMVLAGDLGMSWLFGPSYGDAGGWLALIAARLPWLLLATLTQTALVACRRERLALRLVLLMIATAFILVPLAARWQGAWGVALAVLVVEGIGAAAGWKALRDLGINPDFFGRDTR